MIMSSGSSPSNAGTSSSSSKKKEVVPALPLKDVEKGGGDEATEVSETTTSFLGKLKLPEIKVPDIKLSDIKNLFAKNNIVVPTALDHDKICLKCHEYSATKRICCNAMYCDYCYTKNKLCPNCDAATRREKMTGATFILNSYSEHEECRVCLDPAVKRRCCNNYYCDDCYYKLPKCRSCETPVGAKPKLVNSFTKAAIFAILLGYAATILTILIVVGSAITITQSESIQPVGIYGYTCFGFFRSCDTYFCMDFNHEVINNTIPIPPLTKWQYCDINSVAKLQAYGCVYDMNLYISSKQKLGFDICNDQFNQGMYVFEDTFEFWHNISYRSNDMKSALWHHIVNGYSSDHCGGGETYPLSGVMSANALTFNGEFERSAETKSVDLRSGGWLEADLFVPPIGYDISHPFCKTTYGGYIAVEMSIDEGLNYQNMGSFDGWKYRQKNFFKIHFEVPEEGRTRSTRFRFKQYAFEAARDNWALDNVKIFRKLPPDWHANSFWMQSYTETKKMIQKAQCCFDTDWCETRLSMKEMDKCINNFPYWPGRKFLIRGAELLVCVVTFINFAKFCYIQVQEWLVRSRYPFYDEFKEIIKLEWIYRYIPARYRPKRHLSDYAADIHLSARLAASLKDEFNDGEGDGVVRGKQALIEAEKKKKEKERKKKEKKKLKKRMQNKNFQAAFGAEVKLEDSSSSSEEEGEEKDDPTKFGSGQLTSKMDKFKRNNVAMLRIPFETKVDLNLRRQFTQYSLWLMAIMTLVKISTTSYYVVHQTIRPYNAVQGDISVTSAGLIIFAFYCDFKDIYFNLKYIVPARDQWLPYVTVDLSDEVNALFVGPHKVKLDQISEAVNFSSDFVKYMLIMFYLGAFPYCTLSLILRDQFLNFQNMRLVTPVVGSVCIIKAFLGSGWIIKLIYSFGMFFSTDMKKRELLGYAIQSDKVKYSAYSSTFIACFMALFVFSIFLPDLIGYGFLGALVFGFLYGAGAGCFHSMPLRPWCYLTTLEAGVYLRVKKDERCPCIYWGSSCNDVHDLDEFLMVYTTDTVKFLSYVKNGMDVGGNT